MGGDESIDDALTDDVAAIFLTIRQSSEIIPLAAAVGTGGGTVGTIIARKRSNFNVSFLMGHGSIHHCLWLLVRRQGIS
jgi:hypothetical protein